MKFACHYFFGVLCIVTFATSDFDGKWSRQAEIDNNNHLDVKPNNSGVTTNLSVQGITQWSTWESCSKTCGDGIQRRTLNCTSIKQASKEWQNCIKETQTKNCGNRPCSDFALKCYQCQGSEAFCHKNKLKRNQTYDACNRYHNKCITKEFELEAGAKEVTRGCGNEAECRISEERCKRNGYPRYRCHVSCCEENYCNKGNLLGGPLCDSVVLLNVVLLSLTVHFHWTY